MSRFFSIFLELSSLVKLKEHLKVLRKVLSDGLQQLKVKHRGVKTFFSHFGDVVKHKHRFVVMDTETYKEKFSFQLSGLNIFVTVGVSVIVLVILTTILIAFTPLREYIPGYSNSGLIEKSRRNAYRVDSLEREVKMQQWMLVTMQDVLSGKVMPGEEAQKHFDSLSSLGITAEVYRRSADDSLLRLEVEQMMKKGTNHRVKEERKTSK